jgi:hypothetical protein
MSLDDVARNVASQASVARKLEEDLANQAANTAKNTIMDTVIGALPAPLNAAVNVLGQGIYNALKVPPVPIQQPALNPNTDPIKAFAFSIAFAIIQAIWCFIKSLLNPLPIIGSFFPLCNNSPDLVNAEESALDPQNQSLGNAENEFSNFLNSPASNLSNITPTNTQPPQTPQDEQGITFEQYLTNNGISSGRPTTTLQDSSTQRQQQQQQQPQQKEPEWQRSEQTFDNVRKRFGL